MTRVGHGVDVHRFGGTPPLILCGVVVDESRGVEATSDGDVGAHAITDALLGAAALGDIGVLAPETDPTSHGADSMSLLRTAAEGVRTAGFTIANVDVTVVAQNVRVEPVRQEMRQRLAAALGIDVSAVSVKATTTDRLGFLGGDEGIAALATAAISRAQTA